MQKNLIYNEKNVAILKLTLNGSTHETVSFWTIFGCKQIKELKKIEKTELLSHNYLSFH